MNGAPREYLGRDVRLGGVDKAYLRGATLEVDTLDWYDVRRRRLQLDEVARITLHREPRAAWIALWLLVGGMLGLIVLAIALTPSRRVWEGVYVLAALALLAVGLAALGWWANVLTVIAPRARIRIVYGLQPSRARRIYRRLAGATEKAQADVRARSS